MKLSGFNAALIAVYAIGAAAFDPPHPCVHYPSAVETLQGCASRRPFCSTYLKGPENSKGTASFTRTSTQTTTAAQETTTSTTTTTSISTVYSSTITETPSTETDTVTSTVTTTTTRATCDNDGVPGKKIKAREAAATPKAKTSCGLGRGFASSIINGACNCILASSTTTTTTVTSMEATATVTASTITTITTDTTISSTATTTTTTTTTETACATPVAPAGNAYCQDGTSVNGVSPQCTAVGCSTTNLRIEGTTGTIYEGVILAGPREITTASGGTHTCDGTNDGANSAPFNNGITTIDAASKLCDFGYDGPFSSQFDDFYIQTIGDSSSNTNQFWGILNNYAFTAAGGCETEVEPTDELLWAFNAFNVNYFLRVQPTQTPVVLSPGQTMTFTIQGADGSGDPFVTIAGAQFAGQTSVGDGTVSYTAPNTPGTYRYKATRGDSIRSNAVTITVQG